MNLDSKKVLIVEDDLLLLLVQERLVKKFGYEVIGTACEGLAAYRMIRMYQPDVIMMDINLEDEMKGTEVVEMIRKEGDRTPVIFLSGDRDSEHVRIAKRIGGTDFLLKPVTPEKLKNSLEKAMSYNRLTNPYAA